MKSNTFPEHTKISHILRSLFEIVAILCGFTTADDLLLLEKKTLLTCGSSYLRPSNGSHSLQRSFMTLFIDTKASTDGDTRVANAVPRHCPACTSID
jgi:hypothetical protein